MRAAFVHGIRDVRVGEMPDPKPGPGEVVIRTRAVTICASDIHQYAEGNVGGVVWDRPYVPGHEAAGIVEDPNGSDLAPGTAVVLDPAVPCHSCDMCAMGNYHLCRNLKFCDLPPVDGAMRELVAWPADRVFPLPPALDIVEGPLIEPLSVAVHALELASRPAGATVAVAGCGAIGLLTIQMARVRGAKAIFATDPIPERVAAARELGADVAIEVGRQDPVDEIMRATEGRGVDLAFEAAGPQDALQQCLGVLRPAGELVVIGIPSVDDYTLASSQLRRHELTIRFVRRQNENFPEGIELVREGRIKLGRLLTHRFPLGQVKEAFALAERKEGGSIRVAVTF